MEKSSQNSITEKKNLSQNFQIEISTLQIIFMKTNVIEPKITRIWQQNTKICLPKRNLRNFLTKYFIKIHKIEKISQKNWVEPCKCIWNIKLLSMHIYMNCQDWYVSVRFVICFIFVFKKIVPFYVVGIS